MSDLSHFKENFALLLEAGFIAINQADEDSAVKLFRASSLLKPDSTIPKLGFGYLHLHKLELKKAVEVFEEVLRVEPENEMAKALLGLTLSLTPNQVAKGEKILEETVKHSHDKQIKGLAESAIDFVERFVKQTPSPAVQPLHTEKRKKT